LSASSCAMRIRQVAILRVWVQAVLIVLAVAVVLTIVAVPTSSNGVVVAAAWTPPSGPPLQPKPQQPKQQPSSSNPRRNILVGTVTSVLAGVAAAVALLPGVVVSPAHARDELFRPNPLTNSVLEQIRIWEQAEADNLRYGGELERGDAGNRGRVSAYPRLLTPILQIAADLETLSALLSLQVPAAGVPQEDRTEVADATTAAATGQARQDRLKAAAAILRQGRYEKIAFKKIFNAYGDNIYYSDPDRANLYLGGGGAWLRWAVAAVVLGCVLCLLCSLVDFSRHPQKTTDIKFQ
jgi:hypothetical protein